MNKKDFIEDSHARNLTKSRRKKTLITKAQELTNTCGGELFLRYKDINGKVTSYASSDEVWRAYEMGELRPGDKEQRYAIGGTPVTKIQFPTPSKTSPGDCNFTVTRPVQEPEADTEDPLPLPTEDAETVSEHDIVPGAEDALHLLGLEEYEVMPVIQVDPVPDEAPGTVAIESSGPVPEAVAGPSSAAPAPHCTVPVAVPGPSSAAPAPHCTVPVAVPGPSCEATAPHRKTQNRPGKGRKAAVVFKQTLKRLRQAKKVTRCHVCHDVYNPDKDNREHGRWIGCEHEATCNTWGHASCFNFSEADINKKDFVCDNCKL